MNASLPKFGAEMTMESEISVSENSKHPLPSYRDHFACQVGNGEILSMAETQTCSKLDALNNNLEISRR